MREILQITFASWGVGHSCNLPKHVCETYWDDLSGNAHSTEGVRRESNKASWRNNAFITQYHSHSIGTRLVRLQSALVGMTSTRATMPIPTIFLAVWRRSCRKREDLFAATPPLESKLLFSIAATSAVGFASWSRQKGHELDFIDVHRAYLHAPARRAVYVWLPLGDKQPGMCARLNKRLYGTRDVARN